MKLPSFLVRGAIGVLLALGTAGVATVAAAAPAHAIPPNCQLMEQEYATRMMHAMNFNAQGANFLAAGQLSSARWAFTRAQEWYDSAQRVARC